jgi:hypothetical protein
VAKNDAILLDGFIEEKITTDLLDRGEAFELFSLQQILKSYDLTRDEIDFGWVDGKDDGGIDGFYTFVNGVPLRNPNDHNFPRKNVSIEPLAKVERNSQERCAARIMVGCRHPISRTQKRLAGARMACMTICPF